MKHGFKAVAPQIVKERPGLPADEYARIALERELCGSDSPNPVFSLASTLRKEYREGRMPDLRAEKVNGRLCFFPADYSEPNSQLRSGLRVEVELPPDAAGRVTDLLEIEKFGSPSEAVIWLLEAGIKAKQTELTRVANDVQEISLRKESARRAL